MISDSENILYLILGLGLAAALSAIIMLVQKRKARESWQGVVVAIDSRWENDAEDMSIKCVTITVHRTDGRVESIRLQEMACQMWYSGLKVGDRLVKPAGETVARKA